MNQSITTFTRSLLLTGVLVTLVGCGPKHWEDPISASLDRTTGYTERQDALDQAKAQEPRSPRRIESLHKMVWEGSYPTWQRKYAIDELIAIDENDFRRKLERRIVLLHNWDVIEYIFQLALDRKWDNFNRVAVRQYARPVTGMTEDQRIEPKYIKLLNPGRSVDQVVFDEFLSSQSEDDYPQQAACWSLLARISDRQTLLDRLAQVPDSTANPLVLDLKAAAQLGVIAENREALLWLQTIRDENHKAFWNAAAEAVAKLTPEQRQGLQLRHLPVLLAADADALSRDMLSLRGAVRGYIDEAKKYTTGPTYDGPMRNWPQHFYQSADKLVWADLLTMDTLIRALASPQVRASLFKQADKDLVDTSTEYGGLILFDADHFVAKGYEPKFRDHDHKFIPPDAMIQRMYTALAHDHFHAQRYKNQDYAGPGLGDLDLAERLNLNGLVFTFIDHDTLNVDYYQPGRIVIDLGTITRP